MHRDTIALRTTTICAMLLLATAAATGCSGAVTASEPQGWAILGIDSDSEAEVLMLGLEGAAERRNGALVLDGVTGAGTTEAPEEFDVTESFTVAGWVSATDANGAFATAVSHIGDTAAGFFLGTADGVPAFSMKDADTNEEGHTTRAAATTPLAVDEWVHLAGVFDADEDTITLYIDGAEAAQTAFDSPWQPHGVLTIGRSLAHGMPADHWTGAIAHVRIIPAVSSAEEVETLMSGSHPQGSPPESTGPDPSTYADGQLQGTWDSALTADELALVKTGFTPEELAEFGDPASIRLGFDGPRWWQGVASGDDVFAPHGAPEGDAGVFSTDGSTMTWVNPAGVSETFDWSLDGDQLTLVMTGCTDADGETCGDIDLARVMFERVWTFRSSDPSW